ncbi:hypothetical protein ZWY2020_030677 [Hordeum vulgare]|nr:hypothetical protein ZWY2020_030677 [Hordeum vulgare]
MSFAGVSLVGDGKAVGHVVDVSTASGYHLLVVNVYSHTKATAPNGKGILSLPFMVGGHRWQISYCPNGVLSVSANSMCLVVCLLDDNVTESLKVQLEFSFVDEVEKQDTAYIRAMKPRNFSSSARICGLPYFMKIDALEKSKHLKDDCFTIRCDLNIVSTVDLFIKVPPSSIKKHISDLLRSKKGTDVTFMVCGEKFAAHRCVRAARSTVFKAELFGSMKENTIASVVDVQDMEASCLGPCLTLFTRTHCPRWR